MTWSSAWNQCTPSRPPFVPPGDFASPRAPGRCAPRRKQAPRPACARARDRSAPARGARISVRSSARSALREAGGRGEGRPRAGPGAQSKRQGASDGLVQPLIALRLRAFTSRLHPPLLPALRSMLSLFVRRHGITGSLARCPASVALESLSGCSQRRPSSGWRYA